MVTGIALFLILIDFGISLPSRMPDRAPEGSLRVVAYNVRFGSGNFRETGVRWLQSVHPDIVVISECPRDDWNRMLPDYSLHRSADVCLLSRHEVLEWSQWPSNRSWAKGAPGPIARATIRAQGHEWIVGAVHLETPRNALTPLASKSLRSVPGSFTENLDVRRTESAAARALIVPEGESRPTVVAGDFNLPVESHLYRKFWGDLTNSLGETGTGLRWTWGFQPSISWLNWLHFGVRIDHILTSSGVRVSNAWVGPPMGSDHRPVIADLVLEQP